MTKKNPDPSTGPDNEASPLRNARVVLIHTTHPGNIGSVARAMKNMGLSDLVLVNPKQFPHERAYWRAASAADIIDSARIVDTFEEAIADCGLVVGTSARGRRIPWPLVNPRVCADNIYPELSRHPVALVFGREDRGMTNEELQRCNLHVNIPASEEYSSLNLGMAVQVVLYELRMRHLQGSLSDDDMQEWDSRRARVDEVERLFTHLEETLIDMEFLDPKAPKQLMTRLRRMYSRIRLDDMEVQMMRGILATTQKWVELAKGASNGESRGESKGESKED